MNFKPTADVLDWLSDPQTVEVWKGLEAAKEVALSELRISCSRTTDPDVMRDYKTYDVIESFQKAIKAMKEKQRAETSDASAT